MHSHKINFEADFCSLYCLVIVMQSHREFPAPSCSSFFYEYVYEEFFMKM